MDQAERLRSLILEKNLTIKEKPTNSRVIAISSGKGGVGKSNITLNLGIELSRAGLKTLIFDSDFGLSNIEVLFGKTPQFSFIDVVKSRKTIIEVLSEGPEGIRFISGGSGMLEGIKDTDTNLAYIANSFAMLDDLFDIILIDTGAGISQAVINFILASGEVIIVTTPEPTSLTDSYALIKTVKNSGAIYLPDFSIIVNRVDNIKEGESVYNKLHRVSESFLLLELGILGYVPYDHYLVKSVKMQTPAVLAYPKSQFSKSIKKIAMNIIDSGKNNMDADGGLGFFKKLVGIFNS